MLLENAAREMGHHSLVTRSYSYYDSAKIAQCIYEKKSAIIHIHGNINNVAVGDMIFTSDDYIRIKKEFPGTEIAIQNVFMNYSTLFVGYGGSDPHLEDLMREFSYFFKRKNPNCYIILKKDKVDRILQLYKEIVNTHIIEVEKYDEATILLERLKNEAPRAY